MFITKVSGSGRFTGEGYVGIPYLKGAQIAVTFKDIVVNTDNRLIAGFFETKYDEKNNNLLLDADEYLTGGKGVGDIRSGEEKAQFRVDYTINPDIKAKPVKADGTADGISEGGGDYTLVKGENGKYTFVLTDSEGNEQKVETDVLPVTVEDKEGNTCEVNEKGEVKPVNIQQDIDEVIIPGLSDNYEVIINDEIEKATTDKKLKLVYENQTMKMELQKNNGDTIKTANIEWQVTKNKKTDIIDSTLMNKFTIFDKNIRVVVYEKMLNDKKKEKKTKIAEFEFVLDQSPYITLSTQSGYDGEFGFDDGKDFGDKSVPKRNKEYDTIQFADKNNKKKVLYVPWLTLEQGKPAAILDVKVSENIEGDSIYAESSSDLININYDKSAKTISITNIGLDNDFNNPEYISFYRNDKYGLQKRKVIGKCAVVGRGYFDPIDVQIIYYASDTTNVKNKINIARLQTLLDENSMNQAFAKFNILPNTIQIKDTLNSKIKVNYSDAYNTIGRICMTQERIYSTDQHPTTIYIVMTELQFTKSENNGIIEERGGGVRNNSNLAVMWTVSNSNEDMEKLIIHEIGHTLGLRDVFNDTALGSPSAKFSRYNYMDYIMSRKMFFKTQIEMIINNLTPPKK